MLSMTDSPPLMCAAMIVVGGVAALLSALYLRRHPNGGDR